MIRDLRNFVKNIRHLPTLPPIVTEINCLTDNPKSSASDMCNLISKDMAVSSKILRAVNSAYYGFSQPITDIKNAIVCLGFEAVRDIALSIAIFEKLGRKGKVGQFDRTKFWEHSLGVGITAKIIAGKVSYKSSNEVFISGILHDMGKVVLDMYTPEEFIVTIDKTFKEDILLYNAEKEVYGFTHSEVGRWLAEVWKLPGSLCETIGYHHTPLPVLAKADFDMTAIIHLADIFTRAIGIGNGGDNQIPEINKAVSLHYQSLLDGDLSKLFEEVRTEMLRARAFLSFLE